MLLMIQSWNWQQCFIMSQMTMAVNLAYNAHVMLVAHMQQNVDTEEFVGAPMTTRAFREKLGMHVMEFTLTGQCADMGESPKKRPPNSGTKATATNRRALPQQLDPPPSARTPRCSTFQFATTSTRSATTICTGGVLLAAARARYTNAPCAKYTFMPPWPRRHDSTRRAETGNVLPSITQPRDTNSPTSPRVPQVRVRACQQKKRPPAVRDPRERRSDECANCPVRSRQKKKRAKRKGKKKPKGS